MSGASDTSGKTYLVCVGFMADGNPCTYVMNEVESVEFMGAGVHQGEVAVFGVHALHVGEGHVRAAGTRNFGDGIRVV